MNVRYVRVHYVITNTGRQAESKYGLLSWWKSKFMVESVVLSPRCSWNSKISVSSRRNMQKTVCIDSTTDAHLRLRSSWCSRVYTRVYTGMRRRELEMESGKNDFFITHDHTFSSLRVHVYRVRWDYSCEKVYVHMLWLKFRTENWFNQTYNLVSWTIMDWFCPMLYFLLWI